jgi:hypothetical protein
MYWRRLLRSHLLENHTSGIYFDEHPEYFALINGDDLPNSLASQIRKF